MPDWPSDDRDARLDASAEDERLVREFLEPLHALELNSATSLHARRSRRRTAVLALALTVPLVVGATYFGPRVLPSITRVAHEAPALHSTGSHRPTNTPPSHQSEDWVRCQRLQGRTAAKVAAFLRERGYTVAWRIKQDGIVIIRDAVDPTSVVTDLATLEPGPRGSIAVFAAKAGSDAAHSVDRTTC